MADPGPSPHAIGVRKRRGLPHWDQEGGTYFITFRLAGSLPQAALRRIKSEQQSIVTTAQQMGRGLSAMEKSCLAQLSRGKIQSFLDSGAGECWLANPRIAQIVADTLELFTGKRYTLLAWCIMPNHVHVVCRLLPGHSLAKVVHSWKSFTANQANRILGRRGAFWEREYFDRLARNEADLARIVEYVLRNPDTAGLRDWPFVKAYHS